MVEEENTETHLQKILCEFVPASSSLDFPPHSTLGWPDTVKEEGKRSALEEKKVFGAILLRKIAAVDKRNV